MARFSPPVTTVCKDVALYLAQTLFHGDGNCTPRLSAVTACRLRPAAIAIAAIATAKEGSASHKLVSGAPLVCRTAFLINT